jgi:hypothetical protein
METPLCFFHGHPCKLKDFTARTKGKLLKKTTILQVKLKPLIRFVELEKLFSIFHSRLKT